MFGCTPHHQTPSTRNWRHLESLVEFSFALRHKLEQTNKSCFTDFRLRIGEDVLCVCVCQC